MIVGITGPAGSGKSTFARMLSEVSPDYVQTAFAESLKAMLRTLFGWTREEIEDPAFKAAEEPGLGVSRRHIMQTLGTDWGRNLVHQELWVQRGLARAIHIRNTGRIPVLTDVRFENEATAVRSAGGVVVEIVRDGFRRGQHASEAGLPEHLVDLRVDNNSLEALKTAARNFDAILRARLDGVDVRLAVWGP